MTDDTPRASTYHRTITDDETDPDVRLIESIAEIAGKDATDLPEFYSSVDHLVEYFFQSASADNINAELTFSYAGYRITLYQDGHVIIQELG